MGNASSPISVLRKISDSKKIQDVFAEEEIKSLVSYKEHMGVLCFDKKMNVKKNVILKSVADQNSASSLKPINEIGDICGDNRGIWWHTHNAALSVLSPEDRLSAGKVKLVIDDDLSCAIGVDGYSCHHVSHSPPRVVIKKWDENFFKKLKKSPAIDVIFDVDKKWRLEKGKESTVSQISCSTDEGIVMCSGLDWNTGFNEFPVGAYNQVIFSGNVDVSPHDNGFGLIASPLDKKLECVSINVGNKLKLLYCR